MSVWVEKHNREAIMVSEKNPRAKKKYVFSVSMTVSDTMQQT
jgi:hypothetical protein